MGVAAGDYDGNGSIDLFVTNFARDTNTLYKNLNGNTEELQAVRADRVVTIRESK